MDTYLIYKEHQNKTSPKNKYFLCIICNRRKNFQKIKKINERPAANLPGTDFLSVCKLELKCILNDTENYILSKRRKL